MRFCVTIATIAFLANTCAALAIDDRVRRACERDYLTYCARFDPNGSEVRSCMYANGSKLASSCVDALIAAGEVSKAEVARRRKTDR
jgi:hypothetical protein